MDDRTTTLLGALVVALADELDAGAPAGTVGQPAVQAALATLHSAPGARVDALARVVGITGSGAVRLLDRLAAAGLVERRRDTADQRAVTVWLTAAGAAAADAVVTTRRRVMDEALAALTREQRRALVECAEPLLAHLAGTRGRADRICRLCDYGACPQDLCPVEGSVS